MQEYKSCISVFHTSLYCLGEDLTFNYLESAQVGIVGQFANQNVAKLGGWYTRKYGVVLVDNYLDEFEVEFMGSSQDKIEVGMELKEWKY